MLPYKLLFYSPKGKECMKLFIFFMLIAIYTLANNSPAISARKNPSEPTPLPNKSIPVSKQKRPAPNAKVLYSNVFLKEEPNDDAKNLLTLNEDDKVRVRQPITNNFIKTLIFRGKKKYEGWLHVENVLLSQEMAKQLSTLNEANNKEEPDAKKENHNEPKVNRLLETTFTLPPSSSLTTWSLNFKEGSYLKTGVSETDVNNIRSNIGGTVMETSTKLFNAVIEKFMNMNIKMKLFILNMKND